MTLPIGTLFLCTSKSDDRVQSVYNKVSATQSRDIEWGLWNERAPTLEVVRLDGNWCVEFPDIEFDYDPDRKASIEILTMKPPKEPQQ